MAALNQWKVESTVAPPVPAPVANPAGTTVNAFWTTVYPFAVPWWKTAPIASAPSSSIINEMVPPRAGGSVLQMPGAPLIAGTARPIATTPWNAGTTQNPWPPAVHIVPIKEGDEELLKLAIKRAEDATKGEAHGTDTPKATRTGATGPGEKPHR